MKIAICDDEKRDIKRLVSLLEKYSEDKDCFITSVMPFGCFIEKMLKTSQMR